MSALKKWKSPFLRNDSREGPPDFEELLRKMKEQLSKGLNAQKRSQSNKEGGSGFPGNMGKKGVLLIGGVVVLLWALSGIFILTPQEESAILYFGKYSSTVGPGPHWIPRFIGKQETKNVEQVTEYPYEAEMLTKDENIVSVSVKVHYRIGNLKDYLFSVVDPDQSLQQATASALRQVVGQTTLDKVLTIGRAQLRNEVSEQLKQTLALYNTGLLVTNVTLLPAKPPEQVTAAFDDAIKAREDEQRYINQAQAYSNRVTAKAKGQASRIIEEAEAVKQQVVLKAESETAIFAELLPQYQKTPKIMSQRMYFDAIESVLSQSSKVLMDSSGSKQMFYVPLEKLIPKMTGNRKPVKFEPPLQSAASQEILPTNSLAERFQARSDYSSNN